MSTLDAIRERAAANPYPVELLEHCNTALVLFASGFLGAQDGIFIADAGIAATCVDIRENLLDEMAAVYPPSWEFVVSDAFAYAENCDERFDLVSIDCPSGLFAECAEALPLWCSLARVAVVLGTGRDTVVVPPDGWHVAERRQRSRFAGGVYWTVLQPS